MTTGGKEGKVSKSSPEPSGRMTSNTRMSGRISESKLLASESFDAPKTVFPLPRNQLIMEASKFLSSSINIILRLLILTATVNKRPPRRDRLQYLVYIIIRKKSSGLKRLRMVTIYLIPVISLCCLYFFEYNNKRKG